MLKVNVTTTRSKFSISVSDQNSIYNTNFKWIVTVIVTAIVTKLSISVSDQNSLYNTKNLVTSLILYIHISKLLKCIPICSTPSVPIE